MAEDVNFPLDQTRNTSAFQGLREASRETGRPRRIEDQKEDLNNPERAWEGQEQQPVNEVGSLESRLELSQGARQQAGVGTQNPTDGQNQEAQQDIAEAERREFQSNRQEVSEDASTESRNLRSQGYAGANELGRVSEGFVQDSRVQELVNEQRVADVEDAVRNDHAIDTPDQTIEQFEGEPKSPVQEGLDINPFRGPRPSEFRDDSDASAVETERRQNISSLI